MTAGRRRAPERRSRRARARTFARESIRNGRLPALLLSVGLAVLAAGFLTSSEFVVQRVIVQGNNLAYADSIVAASGALGQSVFRLDTEAVAQRVVAHPAVASAEVSTQFPDLVVVRLHERTPVLVWQTGQRAALVDQHGWVIAEGFDPKLPRVVQFQGNLPPVGRQVPPELVQAARVLGERLGPRLKTLEYDPSLGLVAHLADDRSVVFGTADRLPVKLSVLDAALGLAERWRRLDVREPDRPYYQ